MRRLPFVALLPCLAVIVCAAAATAGAPARRYHSPLGWSLSYPGTWNLEHSRSPSYIRIDVREATAANFPLRSPISAQQSASGASMRIDAPRDLANRTPGQRRRLSGVATGGRAVGAEEAPGDALPAPPRNVPAPQGLWPRQTHAGWPNHQCRRPALSRAGQDRDPSIADSPGKARPSRFLPLVPALANAPATTRDVGAEEAQWSKRRGQSAGVRSCISSSAPSARRCANARPDPSLRFACA